MKKKLTPAQMSKRLKQSPAYRIAYKDYEFLDSGYARPARLQLELLKPETIFRREGITSTIVCFGGTRIMEPKKARANVQKIETKLKRRSNDRELREQLRVAKSVLSKSRFYDEAREFARLVSIESQSNDNHEYVVVTGGGPGIMEAA
ncbi:MAG: hypothetical protein DRP47_07990, partial [Candidatus Zixiibacteriota bacterium]